MGADESDVTVSKHNILILGSSHQTSVVINPSTIPARQSTFCASRCTHILTHFLFIIYCLPLMHYHLSLASYNPSDWLNSPLSPACLSAAPPRHSVAILAQDHPYSMFYEDASFKIPSKSPARHCKMARPRVRHEEAGHPAGQSCLQRYEE